MSALALVNALAVAFVAPMAKPTSIAAVAKPATAPVSPTMYYMDATDTWTYADALGTRSGVYGPYSGGYGYGGYGGIASTRGYVRSPHIEL